MPLMNVQLDRSESMIFARTVDNKRASWEIIRANTSDLHFESYFRTSPVFEWNECYWDCCVPTEPAYVQVEPKSFLVDGGVVFIAWDGFYKACKTPETETLIWTIGISRIRNDENCFLNGDDDEVNFATCTEPVTIVYQNVTGRSRVLSSGGFAVGRAPVTGKRMFFLSILASEGIDSGTTVSEVLVAPEGMQYGVSHRDLQILDPVPVYSGFLDENIADAGTLRLHVDKYGRPDHLCRTSYDYGVSCFSFHMSDSGHVYISGDERRFVTSKQVNETCHVELYKNKPLYNRLCTLATGLEVFWDDFGQPEKVMFGCIGNAGGIGNFTTADRHGTLTPTLPGAYPGSILFGMELPKHENQNSEVGPVAGGGVPWLTSCLLLGALASLAVFVIRRSRLNPIVRVRGGSRMLRINTDYDADHAVDVGRADRIDMSYVELSTVDTDVTVTSHHDQTSP